MIVKALQNISFRPTTCQTPFKSLKLLPNITTYHVKKNPSTTCFKPLTSSYPYNLINFNQQAYNNSFNNYSFNALFGTVLLSGTLLNNASKDTATDDENLAKEASNKMPGLYGTGENSKYQQLTNYLQNLATKLKKENRLISESELGKIYSKASMHYRNLEIYEQIDEILSITSAMRFADIGSFA